MLELAFVVCLLAEPDRCEPRSMTFIDMPPDACEVLGQTVLMQWHAANPDWLPVAWTCWPLVEERGA